MPRKKDASNTAATATPEPATASDGTLVPMPAAHAPQGTCFEPVRTQQQPQERAAETPPPEESPESQDRAQAKWGNPYKAIFTCPAKGFELGEDRRFKQVVFTFDGNPGPDVTAKLREAGFVYRAAEKAWTQPATAVSRELATDLARELKGEAPAQGR